MGRWIADHEFGYRSRTVCTIAFLIAWMRSLFFHRSKHNNCINSNNGIHCIPITRSLTVIQSLKYTTRSNRVWCRRVTTTELLRRVFQPRSTTTTVVSRQSMILLQRCSNKTILNQTYNIAASSTQLSFCDLSRRALSSLDTSSSSSSVVEQKQHQQLRKPTYHDVTTFNRYCPIHIKGKNDNNGRRKTNVRGDDEGWQWGTARDNAGYKIVQQATIKKSTMMAITTRRKRMTRDDNEDEGHGWRTRTKAKDKWGWGSRNVRW